MTPGLAALLANQERVRSAILDAEGIKSRHRRGAQRTQITAFNASGWLSNREARKHPKPFNTRDWEP